MTNVPCRSVVSDRSAPIMKQNAPGTLDRLASVAEPDRLWAVVTNPRIVPEAAVGSLGESEFWPHPVVTRKRLARMAATGVSRGCRELTGSLYIASPQRVNHGVRETSPRSNRPIAGLTGLRLFLRIPPCGPCPPVAVLRVAAQRAPRRRPSPPNSSSDYRRPRSTAPPVGRPRRRGNTCCWSSPTGRCTTIAAPAAERRRAHAPKRRPPTFGSTRPEGVTRASAV